MKYQKIPIRAFIIVAVLMLIVAVPTVALAQSGEPAELAEITPELLGGIFAGALSLVFTFVPSVRDWYDPMPEAKKRQVNAIGTLLIALGIFGLACFSLAADFGLGIACTRADGVKLFNVLFYTFGANLLVYNATKRPDASGFTEAQIRTIRAMIGSKE